MYVDMYVDRYIYEISTMSQVSKAKPLPSQEANKEETREQIKV